MRTCCNFRLQKVKPHRTRITVGGNRIAYKGDAATPTASMSTLKMHWNSVLSAKGTRCMALDIKDFYLNLKLDSFACITIDVFLIPKDFIE